MVLSAIMRRVSQGPCAIPADEQWRLILKTVDLLLREDERQTRYFEALRKLPLHLRDVKKVPSAKRPKKLRSSRGARRVSVAV